MKFKRLTPILYTENITETIKFYTDVLGFTCAEFNEEWQWASLHKNEIKPNTHIKFDKISFTGSFYFEIENAEEFWNILKNSVEIVYPLETFEWGMTEFAIKDNNGYILQFGSKI
ncbi:VOC family protein [Flavobacterium dauae]|uniref:VOC family protein n=1 Tax=Flavobacterium dauae TaxID=1563479 RepID=UPI0034E19FB1